MLPSKLQLNRSWLLILFKLLNDALFVVVVFFMLAMVGEGILPGIISGHIAMSKILIVLALDILAIGFLSKKLELNYSPKKFLSQKTMGFFLIVLGILLFNSLFKAGIFLALAILLFTGATFYFLYKVIFLGNN